MPAIGVHHTGTTDRAWDGPAAVAAAPSRAAVLRYMHAWYTADGDADAKSTYKFPHHGPASGSPAVLAAARAGLAVLGGARGGASIPASDDAGVGAHLRAHIADAQ